MVDPLSVIAVSLTSLFSIIYGVRKIFKKVQSSKCHTNLNVNTSDGKQHKIEFSLTKSIKNLEDVIKNLETKISTIEQNELPQENDTPPENDINK